MTSDELRKAIGAHGGLATAAELGRHWGTSTTWAYKVLARPDAPAPIRTVGGTKLWLLAEADDFRNTARAGTPNGRKAS